MPQIFADPFPIFLPAMRIITDITRSNPAIVTTSFDNDYISGLGSNQRPCVVPVGEINRILTGATVNILNPS